MINMTNTSPQPTGRILVLGGTGKTGRRIAAGLKAKRIPIRIGSRSASPSFDWNNETGWNDCLHYVEAVYSNYARHCQNRDMQRKSMKLPAHV